MPDGDIPPTSSNDPSASKSAILSNCPAPVKLREFVVASKAVLTFIP